MIHFGKGATPPQPTLYIPSYCNLGDHPKTRKFARLLNISVVEAVGHLHFLWWWAMDYAPDGDVTIFEFLDMAVAARWDGDAAKLCEALTESGFIDYVSFDREDGPALKLHNWDQYGGKVLEQRRKNAEKQERWREKNRDVTVTDEPRNRNVTVTSPSHNPPTEKRREEKRREEQRQAAANAPPREKPPSSQYETTLNGAMPRLLDIFKGLDKQYTDQWLRSTLAEVEQTVGPLSRNQLGRGLDLAADQIKRRIERGKVDSPRAFARKLIVDYLTEQRDEHHAA